MKSLKLKGLLKKRRLRSDVKIVSRSPLFDAIWYLRRYDDVRVDPADHFCRHGWREGRDPGPSFSSRGYLTTNLDVASADINPLVHYEQHGRLEERAIPPVRETSPRPMAFPESGSGRDYLQERQLVEHSGLWDETWYLQEYHRAYTFAREHEGFDAPPLDFFLRIGWTLGHRPCAAFRGIVPATIGVNPVVDLLMRKRFQGYQFVENSWFPTRRNLDAYHAHRDTRRMAPEGEHKVVYTCITGNYDPLIQPFHIDADWDYVCFTDDAELLEQVQVGVWSIRPLASTGMSAVRGNRWHKINPHLVLPEYDQSLYIDGNINILTSYIFDLIVSTAAPILMPRHFRRTCLYDEIDQLLQNARLETERDRLQAQKQLCLDDGFPSDYLLTENNVIFRQHHLPVVKQLMEQWWSLVTKYSYRDQASFTYAHWNSSLRFTLSTFPNCRTLYRDFWVVRHSEPVIQRVREATVTRLTPAFPEACVPVVMSCNESFVSYLCVLIQSLRDKADPERNYDVIVLERDLTDNSKRYIEGLTADLKNFCVRCFNMRKVLEPLGALPVHIAGYVPLETYNKIFLAEILKGYDKILYIDSDLVVNEDLARLFDTNLGGKSIGASLNVANIHAASVGKTVKGKNMREYITRDLGVHDYRNYFQAGVLILDLSRPRMRNLLADCIAQIRRISKPLFFDQCIFNSVFYGDVHFFSGTWNHVWYMQHYSYLRGTIPEALFFDYARSRNAPAIVHYASGQKPTNKFDWELSEYFWTAALRSKAADTLIAGLPEEAGADATEKESFVRALTTRRVRLLVHLHLYYLDQLDFMIDALRSTDGFDRDVFVTTSLEVSEFEDRMLEGLSDVQILRCPNVGYDVYPFLQVLKSVDLSKYDYVLKIHTKNARIKERGKVFDLDVPGYKWRDDLVLPLIGSPDTFRSNIDMLETNRSIGCLANGDYIFSTKDRNEEVSYGLGYWREKMGIRSGSEYVGGTMFLARTFPFQKVKNLDLSDADFDGSNATGSHKSLAHVFERLFGVIIGNEGLSFAPSLGRHPACAITKTEDELTSVYEMN